MAAICNIVDLSFSREDEKFRRELRSWLRKHLPRRHEEIDGAVDVAAAKRWQNQLLDAGYLAIDWPEEHGGRGAGPVRRAVLDEEMALHRAPEPLGQLGLRVLGPTLIRCGTPQQRDRFLRPILTAEHVWCRGYDEPASGSDLASLQTRAELDGDSFVVNGRKAWTGAAHRADWMFSLVRTTPDAQRHRGLSYLLIDMRSPGVDVGPVPSSHGAVGSEEVSFSDVRVPRENLVGALHGGWIVAHAALAHERALLASTTRTRQLLVDLLRLVRRGPTGSRPLARDPVLRQKLADLQIRCDMMRYHSWRRVTDQARGRPSDRDSLDEIVTTELDHEICATALEVLGDYGPLAGRSAHAEGTGHWSRDWMLTLGRIAGGRAAQIQKDLVAERRLGLPGA